MRQLLTGVYRWRHRRHYLQAEFLKNIELHKYSRVDTKPPPQRPERPGVYDWVKVDLWPAVIKLLVVEKDLNAQFYREINFQQKLSHRNLLPLLGALLNCSQRFIYRIYCVYCTRVYCACTVLTSVQLIMFR